MSKLGLFLLVAAGCTSSAKGATGLHWAITSNDGKQWLDKGVVTVAPTQKPDMVSLIDLSTNPPRMAFEIAVPGSVQGPPLSVAITPDETLALVTSAMKLDPADPTKLTPDNRISVIDLTSSPPKIVSTVTTNEKSQPSGIAISRDGKLALVANRNEGTVSVLTIAGQTVTVVGNVAVADVTKLPVPDQKITASVAITPDGKQAIATNDGDHRMTLLKIDSSTTPPTVTKVRDFYAGLRPYAVDMAQSGAFAVVGNVGYAVGDMDTLSLIDMEGPLPPHVVDTVPVGLTPEGAKVAPDGSYAVAVLQNGTNKASDFPFYGTEGKLVLVTIANKRMTRAAEIPIGRWCQGAAFSADSKTILVGCMVEEEVQTFSWDGSKLTKTGAIKTQSGPAAIRTAER
jgi:DNA-binding beta-propeller fold protein YncE